MPGISDLLDSDMESNNDFINENSLISSVSDDTQLATEKPAAAKKSRKRKCVTMPKKSRATKASDVPPQSKQTTSKRSTGTKRKLPNDDNDKELQETQATTKARGRQGTKSSANAGGTEEADRESETEQSVVVAQSNFGTTRTGRAAPKVINTQKPQTKPKTSRTQTQPAPDVPLTAESDDDGETNNARSREPPVKRARTESRIRQEPAYRKRAGSASDTERGDPVLRRKLGDITRKFENVELKYRNLKEVGVGEANANMEKLRRQCEATTEASNKLVASLRKELSLQVAALQETRRFKKDLQVQEDEIARLKSANSELNTSLTASQNQAKGLQAKLDAARSASVAPESKAPGSAPKGHVPVKTVTVGNQEASHLAQLKLDLYGDLTGLIIRNVKQAEDGDTYDCIQTGRNGTLHFKLFIDQEDARNASFAETEFLYTPLLDANRDHDMIELMPAYLTEDITFARQNAAKFYGRVVDTLTKRHTEE